MDVLVGLSLALWTTFIVGSAYEAWVADGAPRLGDIA